MISHVSDTARWLAVYRTQETARPDALFRDPLAQRFADAHAAAVAAAPAQLRNGWPIVVRTKLIDDLVLASVAEGCDSVLNLAAGLDTRPYRLPLPASLSWVEADLPDVIDEKERLLAGETPACRVTRERLDVGDAELLGAFLDRTAGRATRALVLTEGLLVYLDEGVVRTLARDLAGRATVRWWVLDVASPAIAEVIERGMRAQSAKVPLKFAPADGIAFFEALGWRACDVHALFREAVRLRRVPLFMPPGQRIPEVDPRNPGPHRWAGVVRFTRA